MHAEVTAESGLLEASEGGGCIVHVVGVDPHRPRANLACGTESLLDVARPDSGGETVDSRVREIRCTGNAVAEGHHRQHGAEDLLARESHVALDTLEDGRLNEVSLAVDR